MLSWSPLFIALVFVAECAFAQPAEIPMRSGGVGSESREEMMAVADDFSLHITLATRSGSFLAGVSVEIREASGAKIAETVTEGPLLYVDLPPGRYTVAAMRSDGPSGSVPATVPATGPPVRVVLRIGETDPSSAP